MPSYNLSYCEGNQLFICKYRPKYHSYFEGFVFAVFSRKCDLEIHLKINKQINYWILIPVIQELFSMYVGGADR